MSLRYMLMCNGCGRPFGRRGVTTQAGSGGTLRRRVYRRHWTTYRHSTLKRVADFCPSCDVALEAAWVLVVYPEPPSA